MIEVVSAVILRDDRLLLQQRSPKRDYPWTWECPGRKVEEKETPTEALSRELIEEVGMLVSDRGIYEKPLYDTVFRPPEVKAELRIRFFLVEPRRGWMPKALDAHGIGWFNQYEMNRLVLTPGNQRLVFHLEQRDGFKYFARRHQWR